MGGPSGGNGGGNSDKKTEFGYTQPKSTIEKVGDFIKGGGIIGAAVRGIKNQATKSKQNTMDYEGQAAGVTSQKGPRDARTGRGGRDDPPPTKKSTEQPKVASKMDNSEVKSDLIIADKIAPTDVEMTDDEKLLARKRGRKTKTVLTSVTGDNTKATLSKKTLLGG